MSREKQNAARTAVDQIEDGMLVWSRYRFDGCFCYQLFG